MGHMLKNTVFKSGSYALGVPVGSSSIGPDSPTEGQVRWNATPPAKLEYYSGSNWLAFAHEGSVAIVKDSFTGDNVNNVFGPMSYTYTAGQEAQVIAVVNNVIQNPGVGFTFDGSDNITFTSTPITSAPIYILHNYASTTAA
jgi:hypothetical protein